MTKMKSLRHRRNSTNAIIHVAIGSMTIRQEEEEEEEARVAAAAANAAGAAAAEEMKHRVGY